MNSKASLCSITILLLAAILATPAAAVPTIRLTATRLAVLSDGRDSTEVMAEVRDSSGSLAPDGTQVNFMTTIGQFLGGSSTITAPTRAGNARVRLSSPQKGSATVQASSVGALAGGQANLTVLFTDDPSDTFQGNTYVALQATGVVTYNAGDKIVDASGRPRQEGEHGLPGAHLAYRNIEIFADQIQLDCTANYVRARGNVVLRRGGHRVNAGRLFYPLTSGDGFAIAEVDKRLKPVKIKGNDLKLEPAPNGISPKMLEIVDFSDARLVITAREILVFPGEKLQFKRPVFYQDGQRLMSMPLFVLALYSTELFSDQFVSVGSQGLSVNVPLYYNLTPGSTGTFLVRHGEQYGTNVTARRPGWSLDVVQAYNSLGIGNRYAGQFGLTGLSRSDWGMQWNHSHEFSPDTRGTFFLDFPQHRSLYASTNLQRQMGAFFMGMNLSANRNISGLAASGNTGDVYLETMPKKVAKTGYTYSVGTTAGFTSLNAGVLASHTATETIQTRFNSPSFHLDKETTLTNYFAVGNAWAIGGNSGPTALASVAATRSMKHANLMVSYDYTRQPSFLTDGSHRVSANIVTSGSNKWNMMFYASTMLDAPTSSLVSNFNYAFLPRWRWTMSASLQKFVNGSYRDLEAGIGRNIGGREIVISYSTFSHRFFFDLQASHF